MHVIITRKVNIITMNFFITSSKFDSMILDAISIGNDG